MVESQSAPSAIGDVTYPQVARVALDQLVEQFMERARDLLTVENQVQGMPEAASGPDQDGNKEVDLDSVLHRIVDAARLLVRVSLTERSEAIGTLSRPEGNGGAGSAAEDQELVRSLASAAGVAVENAELFDEAQRWQAWQSATTDIITLLLAGEEPSAVRSALLGHVMRLAGAAVAAVMVPTEDPARLRVTAGTGLLDPLVAGERLPAGELIAQLARSARAAIVVGEPAADPRTVALTARNPGLGPMVAAPLGVEVVESVLLIARAADEPPFQPPDVEMIASFAAHIGRAFTLAEARRKREMVLLVQDRERIARHLSEQAMQALLGISTAVHGLTARMRTPDDAHRLGEQVTRLDGVLHEMRRAIFALQGPAEDLVTWPQR